MFLPIRTDSPLRRTPYMNWALVAANVVMFLVQKRIWPGGQSPSIALDPREPQILHYFTYQFLHADIMHLLGNMLFLYIFGNNVNDKLGHLGYLAFYLAGGVCAGIFYMLWPGHGPFGPVPIVGASGSISAITGAYLILFPRANVTVIYFFILIGTVEVASLWLILLFFAYDVIYLSGSSGVAHVAHVGGTLFGCAVSYVMLFTGLLPRDQFDVVALVRQWNRRRQYRDAVSAGWNPYLAPAPVGAGAGPGVGRAPPPMPPDPRAARIADLRSAASEAVASHDLHQAALLYQELKTLDPQQVLARQAQLDVANHFAGEQRYAQAVEAYESFLRNYPKFEQVEQVELMLGLIYARYVANYARARELLQKAVSRLHTDRELSMAKAELERIASM